MSKKTSVDMTILKNREKAVIIDTLKNKCSLLLLLGRLELSKSSYYYQRKQINTADKYKELRIRISRLYNENLYKGEITPAVPNVIDRDFHAEVSKKRLTNLTKLIIPVRKIYLSPIVDCFDVCCPHGELELNQMLIRLIA